MKNDDLERLMHDELDGFASPEEAARLKRHIAGDEGDRAKYGEIKELFGLLDRIGTVEPPAGLKGNILRAIRFRTEAETARPGLLGSSKHVPQRHPVIRFAYPFAVGAVVGAFVVAIVTGNLGPRDRDRGRDAAFSGSMMPLLSQEGAVVDRAQLELEGVHVAAEARTSKTGVGIHIGIQSAQEVEVRFRFDPEHLVPMAFQQSQPGMRHFEFHPGYFLIRQAGDGRYSILLKGVGAAHPPLQMTVQSQDRAIEGTLRTGPVE